MDRIRVRGGALFTALASGVFAAGTLTGGPAAHATCASFFGIGNSADCTSAFSSIAVALGPNATATAQGILGAAVAIGTDANALTYGNASLSLAAGPSERAISDGTFATALAAGVGGGSRYAWVQAGDSATDFFTVAIGLGKDGAAQAGVNPFGTQTDRGNVAVFLGEGGVAASAGILTSAINIGGSEAFVDNLALAGGILTSAVNLGGNHNYVTAGAGPLAIAVSAFQSGATVTKSEPGVNINGCRIPDTAAADLGPVSSTPSISGAMEESAPPARRATTPVTPRPAASLSRQSDSMHAGQPSARHTSASPRRAARD